MTLLYFDPLFLQHETGQHPERPARLTRIQQRLEQQGLLDQCRRPDWRPISDQRLARVHKLEYAEQVRRFAEQGGGYIEADTCVSPRSYDAAKLAAGAACDAVERVVRGEQRNALCLVRPPGHHALRRGAMGFCLFNSIAIAARLATTELELERVLVVDWDVHHGNGTQEAFWQDGQVGFLSIHRFPVYPGTGDADERGAGAALGMIRNVPVRFGTPRREYFALFTRALNEMVERVQPQLVLISAGFDAHADDPIGSLGLETEDFETLTDLVLQAADAHAGGKVVSLLEGGYDLDATAASVELHLRRLLAPST